MSRLNAKTGGAAAAALFAVATAFIGAKEGLRTKAYPDPATHGYPWTVCYGETKGVRPGMRFTKEECRVMFGERLDKDFAPAVERCIPDAKDPAKMKPEVYVPFLSLAYNIGVGGFCRSSIPKLWNAGRRREACYALRGFNHAAGRVNQGLINRRRDEVKLCLSGI